MLSGDASDNGASASETIGYTLIVRDGRPDIEFRIGPDLADEQYGETPDKVEAESSKQHRITQEGPNMRKCIIACACALCIAAAVSGCSGAAPTADGTDSSNGSERASTNTQTPSDAHAVVAALEAQDLSITTMESCTSGLIASNITDTEGASAIFPGGYVTYSNGAKVKAGVDAGIIDTYGVYSAECAEAMARAAQSSFGTDIAIGITGTTGNVDANNKDSVKGEVYYCIVVKGEAHPYHLQMDVDGMTRNQIKQAYADDVFRELGKLIA